VIRDAVNTGMAKQTDGLRPQIALTL